MVAEIWTSRVSHDGPNALNITRQSGRGVGLLFAPSRPLLTAAKGGELAWDRYEELFTVEMRRSYQRDRPGWEGVLARPRVVLTCYCPDHAICHRSVVARILSKLGGDYKGELGLTEAVAEAVKLDPLTPRDLERIAKSTGVDTCVLWCHLYRVGRIRVRWDDSAKAVLRKARAEKGGVK